MNSSKKKEKVHFKKCGIFEKTRNFQIMRYIWLNSLKLQGKKKDERKKKKTNNKNLIYNKIVLKNKISYKKH